MLNWQCLRDATCSDECEQSACDPVAVIGKCGNLILVCRPSHLECALIRPVFALIPLFALTANWAPPTREKIEADAQIIIKKCKAGTLIMVIVEDNTKFKVIPIKKPDYRTEADLRSLRCVGRQRTSAIDFRPVAEHLLMMRSVN